MPAINPLIEQGTLNRIRGSLLVSDTPSLNVTASYLGKEGISLTKEGDATFIIPTMTGTATSPEPYMLVSIKVALLKTQNIAELWKQRMITDTRVGVVTVYPDAATLTEYTIQNTAIQSVEPMPMNGTDAGFVLTLQGYWVINNNLWNLI